MPFQLSRIANKISIHTLDYDFHIMSKNNKLISHVSIVGHTSIGENNTFYPFTSIGSIPQDLKYKGEKSYLIVGNDNIFREKSTNTHAQKQYKLGHVFYTSYDFSLLLFQSLFE